MAVAELVASTHADRIAVVVDAISALSSVSEFDRVRHAFGPNADQALTDRLYAGWRASPSIGPKEVTSAFKAAAHVMSLMETRGALELVWTGPKTGLIPTRQTEQVMLEVIDSAKSDLFLMTYVFYKASSIVEALNAAIRRNVKVCVLLESSSAHGGTVRGDSVKFISEAVPGAAIYVWRPTAGAAEVEPQTAAVHAKCAVADRRIAFVTSANLTSAALERNMELGLLIRGGSEPDRLQSHLEALVTTKVVERWK
ncbi:MAG: DISARM system phospholipase D-like protein DrmC [Nitrospira sp.]|nr:DISARM system phospholipase D-like protein DrmC [Nitrospira sp.]